ncbi:MAG: sigma 54-interacting transcriptional regulator [Deltaproteobacteria bacterium]|nr:sigma 54-interacting transcriptional regulator [Deltaproteobacteria bacterium]
MQTTPKMSVQPELLRGQHGLDWRLHIVRSGDPHQVGRVLNLRNEEHAWLIGRAYDEDVPGLRFHDGMMSREHLRLLVRGGASETVGIEDLASTNGTWCDGRTAVRCEARSGTVLRFGETLTVLEADAGRAVEYAAPTVEIPGRSECARRVRLALANAAAAVASTQAPLAVLIVGETGVGKEFAASEFHRRTGRSGPLIRVNVAALPDTLFEAELFGAAAGAYTGAQKPRRGRILEADGGTLVLDEVGELPLQQQAKLLRVLEEARIRPLGATTDSRVDVRFVASTNADLDALCAAGRFRADLLARLRGAEVVLPPLRERRADLFDLADALVPLAPTLAPARNAEAKTSSWRDALPVELAEAMLLRPWRFNLRELRAVLLELQRLLGDDEALHRWLESWRGEDRLAGESSLSPVGSGAQPRALSPLGVRATAPDSSWPPRRRRAPPAHRMRALLQESGGNVEEMARRLDCARRQVYRWLEAAGIEHAELEAARNEEP